MIVIYFIMLGFLIIPLLLLFISMWLELIIDIIKDIIETFKGY